MLAAVEPPVALPAASLVRVELSDVEAVVRHRPGAQVVVTLTSPRPDELGVVEDLLVDRAFPDVPGEATVVATFADLPAPTPELVLAALAAAAVARSCAVPADVIAAGLRAWGSADPGD